VYGISVEQATPIVSETGQLQGHLLMNIQQCQGTALDYGDDDDNNNNDNSIIVMLLMIIVIVMLQRDAQMCDHL